MQVSAHQNSGLAPAQRLLLPVSSLRRRCCRDTVQTFRHSSKRCHTITKASSIGDLALINVDYISPSLWLGVALGITGMVLYSLKFRDARGTTEGDIVAASLFVMCGGILTLQGWRLDPILMLSEFVLGGVGIFYMIQTVSLRKQLEVCITLHRESKFDTYHAEVTFNSMQVRQDLEQEQAQAARWSLPRQQTYASDDDYDQLPEGGTDRDFSRTFQQRFQAQRFCSQDDWRQDSSWPRTPGRSAGRFSMRVPQENSWIDDYEGDVPYGVDTSSPKGRVSPESWKSSEP